MVGQAFNPSGISSKEIETREDNFVREWAAKTLEDRKAYWNNVQVMDKVYEGSWPWQWCAFSRAFVDGTTSGTEVR